MLEAVEPRKIVTSSTLPAVPAEVTADTSRRLSAIPTGEPYLYDRAQKILSAQDAKLEAKVRARTEPYKYANTAVNVDFGGVKQGDQDDEPVSTVDGGVADVKDAA